MPRKGSIMRKQRRTSQGGTRLKAFAPSPRFTQRSSPPRRHPALRAAADRYLDVRDLGIHVEDGNEGIVFIRGHRNIVAYLFDRTAVTRDGRRRIRGNFLVDGPHWEDLHELMRDLHPARDVRLPLRQRMRLLTSMPAPMAADVATAASHASARIRTSRTRAFGCPVVLMGGDFEIRFEPVHTRSLVVPFRFQSTDTKAVEGAIRLRPAVDPLTILVDETVEDPLIARAWVIALLGFAELTCVETIDEEPSRLASVRRPSPGSPQPQPPRRVLPRAHKIRLSAALTPTARHVECLPSHVPGHRRRLLSGQKCGVEARAAAHAIGIELDANETWVQPYARGVPDDIVLRFGWHTPHQIASL